MVKKMDRGTISGENERKPNKGRESREQRTGGNCRVKKNKKHDTSGNVKSKT